MHKIGHVAIVVGIIMAVYLLMLVIMPMVTGIVSTANYTIEASVNTSLQPGSTSFLLSTPWILWFCPAAIGIIIIVVILKRTP